MSKIRSAFHRLQTPRVETSSPSNEVKDEPSAMERLYHRPNAQEASASLEEQHKPSYQVHETYLDKEGLVQMESSFVAYDTESRGQTDAVVRENKVQAKQVVVESNTVLVDHGEDLFVEQRSENYKGEENHLEKHVLHNFRTKQRLSHIVHPLANDKKKQDGGTEVDDLSWKPRPIMDHVLYRTYGKSLQTVFGESIDSVPSSQVVYGESEKKQVIPQVVRGHWQVQTPKDRDGDGRIDELEIVDGYADKVNITRFSDDNDDGHVDRIEVVSTEKEPGFK